MSPDLKTTPGLAPRTSAVRSKISYEKFLATPQIENVMEEWADGEIVTMVPPSSEHQGLAEFLMTLVVLYNEIRPRGRAFIAPFQMKTGPALPGREPDLLFITSEHLGRVRKNYVEGPADIAVEIISPESAARDRGEKFQEYEKGGVREYWLIDPERKKAESYRLGGEGKYVPMPVGVDGVFRSLVLEGFWLKVDWLWQDPLPPRLGVLREWGLI